MSIVLKSNNKIGIILGICGYFLFVLLDSFIKKFLINNYPIFQILFFITFFSLIPIIMALFYFKSWAVLINNKIYVMLLRGFLGIICGSLIINSFNKHSFSEIYPILFITPLILTIFSYFFLKESVGPRRWIAILIGFCGVLIVSRPGTVHFTWALFGLFISAIILAINIVIIRRLAASQSAIAFTFYGSIAGIIISVFITSQNFIKVNPVDYTVFLFCGIICGIAALCISGASKILESSIFAPIQYMQLVAGIGLGYLFFSDLPDTYEIFGSLIIITSGLFIIYREYKLGLKPFVKE